MQYVGHIIDNYELRKWAVEMSVKSGCGADVESVLRNAQKILNFVQAKEGVVSYEFAAESDSAASAEKGHGQKTEKE